VAGVARQVEVAAMVPGVAGESRGGGGGQTEEARQAVPPPASALSSGEAKGSDGSR